MTNSNYVIVTKFVLSTKYIGSDAAGTYFIILLSSLFGTKNCYNTSINYLSRSTTMKAKS